MGVVSAFGLPLDDFLISSLDVFMISRYQEIKPEGSGNFQPALTETDPQEIDHG